MAGNVKKYHHTIGYLTLLDDPKLYLNIGAFDKGPKV